jgi:uncharacterized protein YhfF
MPTLTSYEMVGIKEDVSPVISNVSPTDVPFSSDIGTESITQRVKEWMEDTLRAPASSPKAEGADATDSTLVEPTMRTNYTQIFMDAFKVSGSADASDTYGRAKESAYQLVKTGKQLKRDLEYGFVGTAQTKVIGDNTTPTARKFDGYQAQIANANVVYTGAGPAPLDEAHFLTALQKMFDAGTDPTVASVTSSNSLVVAAFAKASGRYRQINDQQKDAGKLVNVVDLYVSPFGQVRVKINRWQKSGDTLIYNPEMWKKLPFRNWTREPLAKTGDASRQMLVAEFSLKHANQLGSALIVEGTTGL